MAITGIVTKTVGQDTVTVPGAVVTIRDLRLTTQTDAKGAYEFRAGLVPGDYKVYAEFEGLKSSTPDAVPVTVGKTTQVLIHLGGSAEWKQAQLDTLGATAGRRGKVIP